MRELNKTQRLLMALGGVLMTVAAFCFCLLYNQAVACWFFLAGSVLFSVMQSMQIYEGKDLTIARLKRIQSFAGLCLLVAGLLMVDHVTHFLLPLFDNAKGDALYRYQSMVTNKWVIVLLVAAVLELYTVFRLESELKKKTKKS